MVKNRSYVEICKNNKIEPKRDDQGLNLGLLTRYMYVITNESREYIVRKRRDNIVKSKRRFLSFRKRSWNCLLPLKGKDDFYSLFSLRDE